MSYNLIMQGNGSFVTFIDNKPYTVREDHPKHAELLQAVRDENGEEFKNLFTAAKMVAKVYNNTLTRRIVEFAQRDLPVEHMLTFLNNLMSNPSRRAVEELYTFLEHRNMPITQDGCFLAYKAVRENYKDKHSCQFDNNVGAINEMPRNEVDDDALRTCSYGFHVGALEYAGPGGVFHHLNDHVMIVKVNPKDAVSVPADHNAQKLRVCRYEVVGEYDKPLDDNYDDSFKSRPIFEGKAELQGEVELETKVVDPLPEFLKTLEGLRSVIELGSDPFFGKGTVRLAYSHSKREVTFDWPGVALIAVKSNRREYSEGYLDVMVCYNTDGTIRWISARDRLIPWRNKFIRYTEAR